MIRCEFSVVKYSPATEHAEGMIILRDHNLGAMSVTNDAENVTEYINRLYPDVRIFYYDSMGELDELVHHQGVFWGYKPASGLQL